MLEIVKACSALDVGERFRDCLLMPLENLSARNRPLELANEFLQVVLDDAI